MLSSITPLGERGRASSWPVTVTSYVVGSAFGGAAVGTLLGVLGWLLPLQRPAAARIMLVLLAAACLVSVLVELGRLPRLPTVARQVDEDWLHRYRGWVYGVGYGAQLGAGVVTIVTSPVLYAALVLAALTGSPLRGGLVGLTFGVARALPVLSLRRVTTTAALARAHRRLEALAPAGRTLASSALLAVAAASAAQALTTS